MALRVIGSPMTWGRFSCRIPRAQFLRRTIQANSVSTCNHILDPNSEIGRRGIHMSYYLNVNHEPDYLDPVGPQVAHYDLLNFQITGYDYTILEEFGKYVHNTAERFGLEVEDAWATPSKHLKIIKLKSETTVVDAEYQLQLYERNVQLAEIPSTLLPLFINIIEATLPAGVSLSIHTHDKSCHEVRYVPDLQLKELRGKLDTYGNERKVKRKY